VVIEINVIELTERYAKFIISGLTPASANALRRCMINEVPRMAIDEVNFYENTSVLFDEQLALRLGLIPLRADPGLYVLEDECTCEDGCSLCQSTASISAEGPIKIYSSDLVMGDENISVADDNILIVDLKDGQKLLLNAIIKLGTGEMHAKWQNAVVCGYKNIPHVSITDCNDCGRCVDVCPRDVFKCVDGRVMIGDDINCSCCNLCVEACELDGIVIEEDPEAFLFKLETDGGMTASALIVYAVRMLRDKAVRLKSVLERFSH